MKKLSTPYGKGMSKRTKEGNKLINLDFSAKTGYRYDKEKEREESKIGVFHKVIHRRWTVLHVEKKDVYVVESKKTMCKKFLPSI